MSETKLLSCPFCGGEAGILKNGAGCFQVYCDSCETRQYSFAHKTKESAIKAWNTRKPMDEIVERLEEKSYDSMHLDMSTPMTETWQMIDLKDAIDIVRNAGKDGAE